MAESEEELPEELVIDAGDDFDGPSQDISPEERRERNLAAFKAQTPALYNRVVNHKPVSKLVFDENGSANVAYQDFELYPEGSDTYVADQIQTLGSHVFRPTIGNIGKGTGLDYHTKHWQESFVKKVDQNGYRFTHQPFRESSYFTIVMGIGLGGHINPIIEKTHCRVLILVEPNLDFLYHSLSVFDWEGLFSTFLKDGIIQFFFDSDPGLICEQVKGVFRQYNPMSLDGAIILQHYNSLIFQEVQKNISETLRTAVMGLGFYQDEINMIGQTYKNLEKGKSRVVRTINDAPGLPAFIVATGPSLDKLIPFLKENQDKAVIFSCGTSLHVLMKNGIVPDFWVNAERDYAAYGVAADAAEKYDLSDIRFAGSSTVFPKMPELFKESILFFRPGLAPAPLFAKSNGQIALIPDPLAANAGLSFALHVGFNEVYFLGVDTGSKEQRRGHAKGSWYEDNLKDGKVNVNFNLPVPGNFGGTVWTLPVYQWSRENIEKLITMQKGRVFYNLGDGALIKGATPLHPRAVKLSPPAKQKPELVSSLVQSCPVYTETDFEQSWEKAAMIDRLPEFCQKLKDAVTNDTDCDDFEYLSQTAKLLKPAQASDPVAMLLRGTIFTVFIVFEYYANRAVDKEERQAMYQLFQEEYIELIDQLCDRAIEIFEGLEDGEPWEQDFSH